MGQEVVDRTEASLLLAFGSILVYSLCVAVAWMEAFKPILIWFGLIEEIKINRYEGEALDTL